MSNQFVNNLRGVWAERFAAQQAVVSQPNVQAHVEPVVNNTQSNSTWKNKASRQFTPRNNTNLASRYTVTVNGQAQKPQQFNRLDEKVREALVTAQTYLTNLCVEELKRGLNEDSQLQCLDYLLSYSGRLYVDGSDIVVGEYTFNCSEVSNDEHWQSQTRSLLGKVAPQLYCKFYYNNNQLVMNLRK